MLQEKKDINKIKLFVLDMDGTFYLGNKILDGSLDFINKLKTSEKDFLFFTNNSSKSPKDYIEKLHGMNCNVDDEDILTSGDVTIDYLKTYYADAAVYLLGTKELRKSFLSSGIKLEEDKPEVVVVGFDTELTYEKLEKACSFIREGAKFIATHVDINCPTEKGFIPDCGAICAAIELSTGVSPEYMGKPQDKTANFLLKKRNYEREEIAFVGDRLYTDVATGIDNGSAGILVLTGETKLKDVEKSHIKPHLIFESLKEMGEYIE